jgi:hypothetical protein
MIVPAATAVAKTAPSARTNPTTFTGVFIAVVLSVG